MNAERASGVAPEPAPTRGGFDLIAHLASLLEIPRPQLLIVKGASGTGKSTLLRTLVPLLRRPRIFLAYRSERGVRGSDRTGPPEGEPVSLLMVDPQAGEGPEGTSGAEYSMSFAPAAFRSEDGLPTPLVEAAHRLDEAGGGCVIMDSWDRGSEELFRSQVGDRGSARVLSTGARALWTQLGSLPATVLLVLVEDPGAEAVSSADGVIELGWEDVEGFALRVLSVPKLRLAPVPEPRFLYSLDQGEFRCPTRLPPGFEPPIGPPDDDPDPRAATIFPGSQDFAGAFGRLPMPGFTGLEVPSQFASRFADVFLVPLVAHTLTRGGRVVWIPSASSGPAEVCAMLDGYVPKTTLREGLRVLSSAESEEDLGDLAEVALPVRREPEVQPRTGEHAPAVRPLFPSAYDFFRGQTGGRPCLYAIAFGGIHEMAAAAGMTINPSTFPFVVGAYARLPGFHAFALARSGDPLTQVLVARAAAHVRIEERYGRTLLFGVRPRTNPYLLDWPDADGRYHLVPLR